MLEHAYWRDGRKARLQRVAPACAGTSHRPLAAVCCGSGSSPSPSDLPQASPPGHCPSSQDWLQLEHEFSFLSVCCTASRKELAMNEWSPTSLVPTSQETLQK